MSYDYQVERKELFSEAGLVVYARVRDKVHEHLKLSGAFRLQEAGITSWTEIAAIDFMVEKGELLEFPRECWGQYRVFTTGKVHNL